MTAITGEPKPISRLPEKAADSSGPKPELHRYDGKEDKAKVFNEGRDGKEYVVPFQLRLGSQNDSLVLDVDVKNPDRVIFSDDVTKIQGESTQVLRQDGDALIVVQGIEAKHIPLENLTEKPFVIRLNDQVGVEVRGFDPDTHTVFLHKTKLEQPAAPKPQDREAQEVLFSHEYPRYADVGKTITPEAFKRKYPEHVEVGQELFDNAKTLLPQNAGESAYDYTMRVLEEVDKRLRFPGDFKGKQDELYVEISQNTNLTRPDLALMAVEVQKIDLMQVDNDRMKASATDRLGRVFRRDVKTEVVHEGESSFVEGDLEHYFKDRTAAEQDHKNPETWKAPEARDLPQADVLAYTLVADRMLDAVIPGQAEGGANTYRDRMGELQKVLRKGSNATQEEKDQAARDLVDIRKEFYQRSIDTIRNVDNETDFNPHARAGSEQATENQMRDILLTARTTPIDQLIDQYVGVNAHRLSDKHKAKMLEVLTPLRPQLLDLALKGGDLLRRRISYSPPYHKIPGEIRFKKFVQGPSLEDIASPTGRKDGIPKGPDQLSPVPPVETPVITPPEREPKSPEDLTPAPTKKEDENPPPEPIIPPTEFTLGAAVLQERRVQNVLQLAEHSFAHDLPQIPRPGYVNIPIFGGIVWGLRHPVKMIWQQGLLRNVFEQQHIRFNSDMVDVAKRTTDQAVPVEVTPDLVERSLHEARIMRGNLPIWRRAVWGMSDYAKGLLGVSQTSEQKLAKEWFTNQIRQPAANRDPELAKVTQRTLQEQTKLGDRYARRDKGMTLDQSNRLVLGQNAGETRHELPQEMREQANQRVKEMIARYVSGQLNDAQLVAEVDHYLLGDFRNSLPANLQQEFTAPEVASNILSIAHTVTGKDQNGNVVEPNKWQEYQAKPEGSEQTYWEKVNIDVLFGKGEWGGVRGRKEMGFITERLAHRLANREAVVGTGLLGSAAALAQDVVTYGGAYAAGWGISSTVGATSTLARSVGGVVGVGVLAGFKETGIGWSSRGIRGIKGRYIKEVEQAGREAARGTETPAQARIRAEMQAVLVNRVSAETTAQTIEQLTKEQLTEAEARQLLLTLAQTDARLRLTDLSGSRRLNFKQQNYFQFTEGMENEQYDGLKGSLLNGITRLVRYANENPQFVPQGQQLFTGRALEYGVVNQQLGVFEKYSALAEAQLRVSSADAQVRNWFRGALQMNNAEIDVVMQNMLPNLNLNVQQQESLLGREATLRHLTIRRGVSTAVKTIVAAGVTPIIYGLPAEGVDVVNKGWDKFASDWGTVLRGDVPVDTVNGHPVVNLSPLQKGVMFVEHLGQPPGPTISVQVDNAHLNLPPGLRHDAAHHAIVDTRNGHLIDLTGMKLVSSDHGVDATAMQDFNHDGVIDSRDDILATNYLHQRLAAEDIKMSAGPDILVDGRRDIIVPGSTHEDIVVGHKTVIPNGSEWIKDPTSGKWDLVVSNRHDVVLLNDAKFDATGKLVDWDHAHSNASILGITHDGHDTRVEEEPPTIVKEPPVTKTGPEAAAEFEKHGMELKGREWYANNTRVSDLNELRLYTHHEGNAVILDMSKMHGGFQTGLFPEQIDVQDVIKRDEAVFAFSLPGHEKEPIIVHAPGGQLRLDPTDNDPTHKVSFVNGKEMQAGDFARMVVNQERLNSLLQGDIATELYNRQDVFKLGLDGKMGFAEAGRVVDHGGQTLQAFATIQGSGGVEITIPGKDIEIPGKERIIPGEWLSTVKLTDKLDEGFGYLIPVHTLSQPPLRLPDVLFVPLPLRQNIEKSTREGTTPTLPPVQPTPGQTVPPITPPPVNPPAQTGEAPRPGPAPAETITLTQKKQELERLKQGIQLGEIEGILPTEEEKDRVKKLEEEIQQLEATARVEPETRGNAETLTQYIEQSTPDLFKQRVVGKLEELRQQYQEMKDHPNNLISQIEERYRSIRGQTPVVTYSNVNKRFEVSMGGNKETLSLDEALMLFEMTRIEDEIYQGVYHVPASLDSIQLQTQDQIDARRNTLLGNFKTHLEPFLGQQHGYWEHFLGNSDIPGNFSPNGRLYVNPYAAYAPEVMSQMFVAIAQRNARGGKKIAIQAKILNHNDLYPASTVPINELHDSLRPDKIVFYFLAEDAEEMFKIAQQVHQQIKQSHPGERVFSKRRPLLTGQLIDDAGNELDGVGFAEEPPNIRASYGEMVSAALAEMVGKATTPITPDYIRAHIGESLVSYGLSTEQPYLFAQDKGSKFTGVARQAVVSHIKDFWNNGH